MLEGYKQTEVGVIPEDWEVIPLGQVSDVIMGQSPIGSTYNKAGEGVALINGPTEFTDVYPVKVQWTTHPTKICKKNDLLICVRGSSTGRMNVSDDEYCIGRGVAAIRAKSSSNTVYLTHQIHLGIEKLLSLSAGSTFPNVDGKSIRSIQIPLPPTKAEQTAIATALSDADALIQSLEKLIAKKRLIKQGAMQELLKPKEGWVVKKLGAVVEFLDGKRVPLKNSDRAKMRGVYPYYGASGIIDYVNDFIYDDNLILLGEDGENILSRSVRLAFQVSGKIWVNNHAHVLKPKENYDITYVTELLESIDYDQYNTGTAQPKLNQKVCSEIPIPLPPTKEDQVCIATILSDMDTEISTLETKLAKYKQLKQGMMQELLTGRIRLV